MSTNKPTKKVILPPKTKRRVLLVSATNKLDNRKLKESLKRARKRQSLTLLFDSAVPSHVQFQGVIKDHDRSMPAMVEIGKHALSPFVLHLGAPQIPTPEELLKEQDFEPIRLNLLEGSQIFVREHEHVDTSNDLRLQKDEIRSQLAEDLSYPPTTHTELPFLNHPRSFDVLLPYARGIKLPEHFTLTVRDSFEPKGLPDDLESYFDLPEDEEDHTVDRQELEDDLDLDLLVSELEQAEQETTAPTWTPPQTTWMPYGWKRAIAGFVAISFIFVLPLHAMNLVQELRDAKSHIEISSTSAIDLLKNGADAAMGKDAASAQRSFTSATVRFAQAEETLNQLGTGTQLILSALPVAQTSYQSGEALLQAGKSLSIAATRLTQGFAEMERDVNPTPVSRSQLLRTYIVAALPHIQDAERALKQVEIEAVPVTYRDQLTKLQSSVPLLVTSLQDLNEMAEFAEVILGSTGSKRYLLIFQNNTEIRPTGGFMGSFAEVKVHDGVIEKLSVPTGGTYDLQGSLQTPLIAPKPVQLLKSKWEFQDANWFPDFPTSARQMIQFYEDAGGPSVDGVIAVNATYVVDLLRLLGPVEMPAYGRVIDSENFLFEAQKIVELEYDKEENKPKAFIGDLAPLLLDRALEQSSERFMEFVDILGDGLQTKEIQMYFQDGDLQRTALAHGWGGSLEQTPGDYLMIVDSNLGGGKTDGVIQTSADLTVHIGEDGVIQNTLSITRTHRGIKNALFSGVNNVDYLRVYVPKGAKLVSSSGFSIPDSSLFDEPDPTWDIDDDLYFSLAKEEVEPTTGTSITEESGKSVFGNWVQTSPGESTTVIFTYELPFSLGQTQTQTWTDSLKDLVGIPKTDRYTLVLQKQSGVVDRTTSVHIKHPESLKTLWSTSEQEATFSNKTDAFVATLFDITSL